MTPQEYMERIDALLAAGDDAGVLSPAARFGSEVHPQLRVEELDRVAGTLEGAAMAVSLEAACPAHPEPKRGARRPT